jgi:hypothetical protein
MTYTAIGVLAVTVAVLLDLFAFKTRMVTRPIFWASYTIIVFFQLITNGLFTGTQIVKYDGSAIIGGSSPADASPAFLGDGRIAFAPVEDILFGFSLVLLSLSLWVFWGRRGIDRTPASGPPIWRK